jgi:hypothetical protein
MQQETGTPSRVSARFEKLIEQIAGWSPDQRAERLEKLARTYAQVIDVQAARIRAQSKPQGTSRRRAA